MKYKRTPDALTVTAEGASEIASLSAWVIEQTSATLRSASAQPTKHRKKHMHKKQCPKCEQQFKGAMGLGIHLAKIHHVPAQKVTVPKGNLSCPHCARTGFNEMGLSVHKVRSHKNKPQQVSLFGETAMV